VVIKGAGSVTLDQFSTDGSITSAEVATPMARPFHGTIPADSWLVIIRNRAADSKIADRTPNLSPFGNIHL